MTEAKNFIDRIENNNTGQMLLCQKFNMTWLHKLSWKEKWSEKTSKGEKTMYAHWKEMVETQI